ncbi:MAG TPA: hypothetical protein VJ011_05535 [Steroidobacteraceae bacterium]|nr:hypothetical protein [Steroidobacteraceae bacterium]
MPNRKRPMSAAEQALRTELGALRRIERALEALATAAQRVQVLSRALEGVREQADWESEAPDA